MARTARPKPVRLYFSFRSPYSWLGYRDLMSRYPDVAERASWRPFWEPDSPWQERLTAAGGRFHYVDMSKAKDLYILQDVRRLTEQRGLSLTWPVDREPRWDVSHLAYLVARRHGRGPEFIEAVYRARWQQGRNISDPATIGEIAGELGLDPGEHAGAVNSPEVQAEGLQALLDLDADGVFGVPFFVHGRDKFWGVDRLDLFAQAVRADQAAGPAAVSAAPDAPDRRAGEDLLVRSVADQGHAGGCG